MRTAVLTVLLLFAWFVTRAEPTSDGEMVPMPREREMVGPGYMPENTPFQAPPTPQPRRVGSRPDNMTADDLEGPNFIRLKHLEQLIEAGDLTGDGLVKALQSIKDFDVGGLMAPITVVNNKIPMGRVYKANVGKKVFEPISDWIRTD